MGVGCTAAFEVSEATLPMLARSASRRGARVELPITKLKSLDTPKRRIYCRQKALLRHSI